MVSCGLSAGGIRGGHGCPQSGRWIKLDSSMVDETPVLGLARVIDRGNTSEFHRVLVGPASVQALPVEKVQRVCGRKYCEKPRPELSIVR